MDTLRRLNEAAEAGEVLTVVYYGGSQPGAKRLLSPMTVTPREIRARDLATGEVKNFLISKIEIVSEDHPAKEYIAGAIISSEFTTINEALEAKLPEVSALGWHVEISDTGVTLHQYFKNGKPKKGADAGIQLQDDSHNRPWYVFGPDLATARTFSHLDKAVSLFLAQAYNHAPRKKTTFKT